MIVQKFGGTSVENAAALERAIDIIVREKERQPIVVLSAIAGATNALLQAAHSSLSGKLSDAHVGLNDLLERHVAILENLLTKRSNVQSLVFFIRKKFEELKILCQGIAILGELTNRSLDNIASLGEILSTRILSETMKERGYNVELVDVRQFMITDNQFSQAVPLFDEINKRSKEILSPILREKKIIVTQGFIGSTAQGVMTTLGRGGSDFSAAIIGASLDAEEIQIWTDVDGILTADPRIVPAARKIKVISFQEASELAYFGAKVLHPSTILPAVSKNIPVVVLNSKNPQSTGTRIVSKPPRQDISVKSIASKKEITVINIQSSRMLMAYGFLESIFSVFSRHRTSVDLVSTSEVAVSLTIDNTSQLEKVVTDLKSFAEVAVYPNKAILCIVGEQLHLTVGVADRIFRALGDINVMMITQGASEINMSLVIDESRVAEAVRRLHNEFFEPNPDPDIFETIEKTA